MCLRSCLAVIACLAAAHLAALSGSRVRAQSADRQMIEPRLIHLRSGPVREWSSFSERPDADHLEVRFAAVKNAGEWAFRSRQQDVKQSWRVMLNARSLGELAKDENDQLLYLPIPAGALHDGENTLRIESPARGAAVSDDVRVGQIGIEFRPVADALSESTLALQVVEAESGSLLPARITIVRESGGLQPLATRSSGTLAVRSGVVYTGDGRAMVGLPAGKYTLYAGRGFEYSLARADVAIEPGATAQQTLTIRREVPTPGYVACDTHIHTLTHSGHGDASLAERMVTLAGEGIELPIATDHNVHIDYEPLANELGVRRYFTSVIGNEVTTAVGHFNAFPTTAAARLPDSKPKAWPAIFDEIFATPGVKVAILNHARDLHSGTRPFGPKLFNPAIGENIDGWPMRFNAMEVINSGATQTDPLRLVHDWMALLNGGYHVTPVGSSDSHDVSRYIVGQGRTYIRCDDRGVANLDVAAAVDSFLTGNVLASYGLLVEATVAGKYQPGDFAQLTDEQLEVRLRVLAPHWIEASRVQLYVNGALLREEAISPAAAAEPPTGVKWQGTWKLPRPKHDVHLVAVATGPGVTGLYWPTAKPYQPTSPDWRSYVLGVSGAIWLDGDGDGRKTSPRAYAQRLFAESRGDPVKLCELLGAFDAATTAQAAHLLRLGGQSLESGELHGALSAAPPAVQAGFAEYRQAWRENERARAEP